MIIKCENLEKISEYVKKENHLVTLDKIVAIDYPFLDADNKFTILSVPSYSEKKNNIIFVCGDTYLFTQERINVEDGKFKSQLKNKYGASTISIFLLLKSIMKNYAQEFMIIRAELDELDLNPNIDMIESNGRRIRKLTDRVEALLQVALQLKEREIEDFNTKIISFDYEVLQTEIRYWLERCRNNTYRIASLRTKSEMKANADLNATIKKLTVITTFLSIISIVVNVPGTIGAIFGIPALSDAYFNAHTKSLVITLIATTLISILLGLVYWRTIGLKTPKTKI